MNYKLSLTTFTRQKTNTTKVFSPARYLFKSFRSHFMTQIYKWEFWPFWFFYIPLYFYWLYLSFRARSLFFFSAANPAMEMGGFYNYSKFTILKKIPGRYLPKTLFINLKQQKYIEKLLIDNCFDFPLIAKPDRGERGRFVEKINSLENLKNYLQKAKKEVILQEFIDYPLEFGIMYYRLPNEKSGHISSIVQKKFLSVIGDGQSTVETLVKKDKRAAMYLKHLEKKYAEVLDTTPLKNTKIILEPIGNHCRGTVFLDANYLQNDELNKVFDSISRQIDGFYFGRYDLKVKQIEDLYTGENIKIMELNGANSEPAHIYDPQMPILSAYLFLFKHWAKLYKISVQNHRKGIPYMKPLTGFRQMLGL